MTDVIPGEAPNIYLSPKALRTVFAALADQLMRLAEIASALGATEDQVVEAAKESAYVSLLAAHIIKVHDDLVAAALTDPSS